MQFIDTHAHLYLDQFDVDRDEVVRRALDSGVKKIYLPNIDSSSIESMLEMETNYPDVCLPMMGLHPCSVDAGYKEQLEIVRQWLDRRSFVAVGEIGTDLYWDKTYKAEQEDAFRTQIAWARELGIPVVIHSRDSLDWSIDIIEDEQDGSLGGVFHCFNGTVEQAARIVDLGFYMGLGGVATFKNSGMDNVVPHLDRGHCVLETDAPYLTPTPHRGKRNESAYVPLIAQRVADLWEMTAEEVADITTANANRLFGH